MGKWNMEINVQWKQKWKGHHTIYVYLLVVHCWGPSKFVGVGGGVGGGVDHV